MELKFDIGDFVNVLTEERVVCDLVNRVRQRRKEANISQRELASKTRVSYSSIRRFESTGEISLHALLRIAKVLGCLDDFNNLFARQIIANLKDYK